MSYSGAAALQAAIYGLLTSAPALAGVPVVDAMPPGGGTGTFILIGPEEVSDASDATGRGAEHRFTLSVISDAAGFLDSKTVASAASSALEGNAPPLPTGRIVQIAFVKARAVRKEEGGVRRIDLTFRARLEL